MYDKTPVDILDYHHSMLTDKLRTKTFKQAIEQQVKLGDIVLDIGCGTGVLTYFACMAGAKRVYAVEQGPVMELAKMLCHENGFADRVIFLKDWSTRVTLPELADVLITETIGNIGFEEGIVRWVLDAKKRNLKKNARILPHTLSLNIVPVQASNDYIDIARWERQQYGLNFNAASRVTANNLIWTTFGSKKFLSEPATMLAVNLNNVDTDTFNLQRPFHIIKDGIIHGLGGWFSAEIALGHTLSNRPTNAAPSWSHGFFPLERPLRVKRGDTVEVRIRFTANGAHWHWQVTPDHFSANGHSTFPQIEQSTRIGGMKPYPLPNDGAPTRNQNGEIDLFVLQKLDGLQTLTEIAQATAVQFPAHFHNHDQAQTRIQEIAAYYCHHDSEKKTH